jgi:hypothetical protein
MTLLYWRHCHRQPVWLFDDVELASLPQQPEELLLALLALTTRFSESPHFRHTDRNAMSQRFGDAARNLVMLKIANGGVSFSTNQSLCLLACAGFAGLSPTSAATSYHSWSTDVRYIPQLETRFSPRST